MEAIGSVVQVNGPVYAVTGDEIRPLAAGDPIYEGETLTTGENANLEVRFTDGSILAQGPGSSLGIGQYAFDAENPSACGQLLHVEAGTYRLVAGEIGEANPSGVILKTPLADVNIRDTGIDVVVDQDWVKVGVADHNEFDVAITTGQGTTFLTDGNQIIEIFADGSFSAPMPFSGLEQQHIAAIAPISALDLDHQRGDLPGSQGEDDDPVDLDGHHARGDAGDDRLDDQPAKDQDDPHHQERQGTPQSRAEQIDDPFDHGQDPWSANGPGDQPQGPAVPHGQEPGQDLGPHGDHTIYDEDDHHKGGTPAGKPGEPGDLDEHLVGDEQDNFLDGRGGNDTLSGGPGVDTLVGGHGEDWYEADNPSEKYTTGIGINLEVGKAQDQWGNVEDVSGIEHVIGTAFDDYIVGDDQDNNLLGLDGKDNLEGGGGNDTLVGGQGPDSLLGGQGHDSLVGNGDEDYIDGGDGRDLLVSTGGEFDLHSIQSVEEFDLSQGDTTLTVAEGDIQGVQDKAMTITGDAGDSLSVADGQWHYQTSEGGFDIFTSDGGATIQVDADLGGVDFANPPKGRIIEGTPEQDSLMGTPLADTIMGLGDDDSLDGGAGHDFLNGGAGHDTILGGHGDDTIVGGKGFDCLGGMDNDSLLGGNGDDSIFGGVKHDTLLGEAGNDTLNGGQGDDCLLGGQGDDCLLGGWGDDTFADFELGDVADGDMGTDVLVFTGGDLELSKVTGVEEIDLTHGDTTLTVGQSDILNADNDTLTITGDAGDSLFIADGQWHYQTSEGGFDIFTSDGGATIQVDADLNDVDFQNGIKGLDTVGTQNQDTLSGSRFDDTIRGLAGDDSLVGGLGDDSLVGGEGTDTFMGGAGDDTIADFELGETADGGGGHDLLVSKGGDFDLQHVKNVEEIDLTQGNSTLTVNQDDILNAGDDTLTITGDRYGDSLYVADGQWEYQGSEGGYKTFCSDGGATLKVNDDLYRMDFQNEVKGLFITGTPDMETLEGSAYNDTLVGLAGNDSLFSEQGDDSLVGGQGMDFFIGGEGDDTIADFELGESAHGGDGTDLLVSTGGDLELSKVTGVEEIDLTQGDTTLTVNQDDVLNADNDTLTITGDAGDSLTITDGSWQYQGHEGGYGIFTSEGGATIQVDEDLGGLEFAHTPQGLVIEGTPGQDNLLGTPFDDTIKGLADNDTLAGGLGADSIDGGAGQDTLLGETGDDTLLGGAGNDSLIGGQDMDSFAGGAGDDTIADFEPGEYAHGGDGTDLLVTGGRDFSLDLDHISGVEHLDLTRGDVSVTVSESDILDLSDTDTLTMDGDAGDSLYVADGNWQYQGDEGGYSIFTSDGGATIKVDTDLDDVDFQNGIKGLDTVGTQDQDTLSGSRFDDTITGLADDDSLAGGDGDDSLMGDSSAETLSSKLIADNPCDFGNLRMVDMNGDGNLDILATNIHWRSLSIEWFTNDGQGNLIDPHKAPTQDSCLDVEATDFNYDGFMDMASVNNSGEVSVWFGDQWGNNFNKIDIGNVENAKYVAAGDLDGDGYDDVIVSGNEVTLFKSQASETFGPGERLTMFTDEPRPIAVFNADGDHDDDLLLGGQGLSWTEGEELSAPQVIDGACGRVNDICVVDMDGDGVQDVIAGCDAGSVKWYKSLNNGQFGAANTIDGLPSVDHICAADVDGDGHMDIIAASEDTGQILFLKNDGRGGFSKWHTFDESAKDLVAGDLDGDGCDDLVWINEDGEIHKFNAGEDTLLGEVGDDTLMGGAGDDCLIGGQDMDSFVGGAGDDTIADFEPGEYAHGGDGHDLLVTGGQDFSLDIDHISGVEHLDLSQGDVSLTVSERDVLDLSDNDTLTITGDAGDSLTIADGSWQYQGHEGGYDTFTSDGGATIKVDADLGGVDFANPPKGRIIEGTQDQDSLSGSRFDDTIRGLADDDSLAGGDGDDSLVGGAGNDLLFGGQDMDSFVGGAGDDTIADFGPGEYAHGGEGDDLLVTSGQDFTLDLDHISGVEHLDLSQGDVSLTVSERDVLDLSDTGTLTLDGDAGDLLQVTGGQWTWTETQDGYDVLTSDGGATLRVDTDLQTDFTNPVMGKVKLGNEYMNKYSGSNYNDTLMGFEHHDSLTGLSGDDSLVGGAGQDTLCGGDGDDVLRGGMGSPKLQQLSSSIDFDGNGYDHSYTLGDIDGDGDLDLVTVSHSGFGHYVHQNLGDGRFGEGVKIIGEGKLFSFDCVCCADLDNDGDADLVIEHGYYLEWYANDGKSIYDFEAGQSGEELGQANQNIRFADLDGDGFTDIVAENSSKELFWYQNGADHSFNEHQIGLGGVLALAQLVNLDRDAQDELLCVSSSEGKIYKLDYDGSGGFQKTAIADMPNVTSALAADLDGDGDLDLVAQSDGAIMLFENLGDGQFADPYEIIAKGEFPVAALDMDGDGDLDLLQYHGGNIPYYEVVENLGAFSPDGPIVFHHTDNFADKTASHLADLDGDGLLDKLETSGDKILIKLAQNNDGDNVLFGDAGDDTLDGGGGNDLLYGGLDDDCLMGGDGNDTIAVEDGQDTIDGGDGTDLLFNDSEQGWTFTLGENGNGSFDYAGETHTYQNMEGLISTDAGDTLTGNDGDNVLMGRGGADILDGGGGADRYYYSAPGEGGDTILSFEQGQDTFGFDTDAFNENAALHTMDGYAPESATFSDNGAYFVFDTQSHELWYDTDGDGGEQAEIIATIDDDSLTTLNTDDFVFTDGDPCAGM